MCWWRTVAARVNEAQQLMGATRVRAPGVLIPLRGFEFFSMIVGNIQVRFQRLPPLAMRLATAAAFSDSVAITSRVIADVRALASHVCILTAGAAGALD